MCFLFDLIIKKMGKNYAKVSEEGVPTLPSGQSSGDSNGSTLISLRVTSYRKHISVHVVRRITDTPSLICPSYSSVPSLAQTNTKNIKGDSD